VLQQQKCPCKRDCTKIIILRIKMGVDKCNCLAGF
jgi:hypothetical protein